MNEAAANRSRTRIFDLHWLQGSTSKETATCAASRRSGSVMPCATFRLRTELRYRALSLFFGARRPTRSGGLWSQCRVWTDGPTVASRERARSHRLLRSAVTVLLFSVTAKWAEGD